MIFRQFIDEDLGCASYLIGDAGEAAVGRPVVGRRPVPRLRLVAPARGSRACWRRTRMPTTCRARPDSRRDRGRAVRARRRPRRVRARDARRPRHGHVRRRARGSDRDTRSSARARLLRGHRRRARRRAVGAARGRLAARRRRGRPDLAVAEQPVEQAARSLHDSLRRLAALPGPRRALARPHRRVALLRHGHQREAVVDDRLRASCEPRARPRARAVRRRAADPLARAASDRGAGDRAEPRPAARRTAAATPLAPERVARLLAEGAAVVDGRSAPEFDRAAIPGSLCLPLDRPGVGTKAAWLLERDRPVVVVAADDCAGDRLAARLAAVGIASVVGRLGGGVEAWAAEPRPLTSVRTVDVKAAARLLGAGCRRAGRRPRRERARRRSGAGRARCTSRGGRAPRAPSRRARAAARSSSHAPRARERRPRRACSCIPTARPCSASRPAAQPTCAPASTAPGRRHDKPAVRARAARPGARGSRLAPPRRLLRRPARGGPRRAPWLLALPAIALRSPSTTSPRPGRLVRVHRLGRDQRARTWIGLGNFREICSDADGRGALEHTIELAAAFVVVVNAIGLSLALGLNRTVKSRNVLRALFFAPFVLSPLATRLHLAATSSTTTAPLNRFLGARRPRRLAARRGSATRLGALGDPRRDGLAVRRGSRWSIYLAGLQGIPEELDEAALVDGASLWLRLPRGDAAAARAGDHGQRDADADLRPARVRPGAGAHRRRPRRRDRDARRRRSTSRGSPTDRFGYGAAFALVLTVCIVAISRRRSSSILRRREARV